MSFESRDLGRARIRFFGYPAKRLANALGRFDGELRSAPAVHEFEDVLFQPGKRCLYDASGRRIEESRLRWIDPDAPDTEGRRAKFRELELREEPETIVPPADPIRVRKPHAYLGELKLHYGHFLTDGLSRAWLVDRIAPEMRVFFLRDSPQALAARHVAWFLEHAGLAGRSRAVSRPLRFDRVVCPAPALQQANRVYAEFDIPHRRAAAAANRGQAPDRPIYLSRRELGPGHRGILREDELEAGLEREGFAVVHPDRLSLDEQVMLFEHDHPVVAPMGSALHTVLFRTRPQPARLAAITPNDIPGRFPLADMVKGSDSLYVNGLVETTGAPVPNALALSQRAWRIDVDLVMAALDAAGLLGRRRPPIAPGRV